jgi:hypothetical protein
MEMFDSRGNKRWYGVLETSRGRTPVIHDPGLPEAPKGQVYLYNAEREAIVAYDLAIVSERLRDAEGEELRELKKATGKAFNAARDVFVATRSSRATEAAATRAPRQRVEAEADSSDDWGDFQLDDMAFE